LVPVPCSPEEAVARHGLLTGRLHFINMDSEAIAAFACGEVTSLERMTTSAGHPPLAPPPSLSFMPVLEKYDVVAVEMDEAAVNWVV